MRNALWILACLAACEPAPPATEVDSRPVLRIVGDDTVSSSLLPALTDTHDRVVGSLRFDTTSDSATGGFAALLAGEADLVASTRGPLPAELQAAEEQGLSLDRDARHIVGVDVLALSAHPSNPLTALTYDEVIGIFCTGDIQSWSELGGSEQPIRVLAQDADAGTHQLFSDFFCGASGLASRVETMPLDEIKLTVEADTSAISFASLTVPIGRVVGLKPDPRGPAVLPSQRNILRGTYPLFHDVAFYSAGPAAGHAADFVTWAAEPAGQEVVDEVGLAPLFIRPEHLDSPRPLRETVHFEPDAAQITQRSLARLDLLADELIGRGDTYDHIVLEGFTDNQEPEPTRLSRLRAEAVRDALVPRLPGVFMEIIPRGPVQPLAPNTTAYGRERNRRVQVYLAAEEAPAAVVDQGDEPADADTVPR